MKKDKMPAGGKQVASADASQPEIRAEPLIETDAAEEEVAPFPSQDTPGWPARAKTAAITGATAFWVWLRHLPAAIWDRLRRLTAPVRWGLAIVLVLLIAIILFLAQPNWNWARPTVASIVSGRLHRPVKIDGNLRVHLFSFTPGATVSGLKIGQPDWALKPTASQNMAVIDHAAVTAELLPVFTGRIVLPRLEITRPTVILFQDKAGKANWDFSNGANTGKPMKLPLIKTFIITDGKLTLTSLQRRMTFKGTVNAQEKADSGRQAFALSGDGSLNGRVFELNATGGPLLNVRSSVPYPFDMAVRAGNTRLTAIGRVVHPFNLGQLDGVVTVSGNNLADLYDLTGLALPDTPAYRLAANVTRDERTYYIKGINGRIGGSDLHGTMKVDIRTNGRPYLTGDLNSRLLDFRDLGTLLGATDANAPKAPEVSMSPQAAAVAPRMMPDVPLDVQRLRGMDAKVRYRALSVKARPNLPLRQVSLGVNLDHGLMILDPIDFTFPQGRLQGTARIDARKAVQSNTVDFRLTGVRLQDFVPQIGGSEPIEGVLNARLKASGIGDTIHKAASSANGELTLVVPGGTIRQSLAELMGVNATKGLFQLLTKDPKKTDVRCAMAGFNIQNGVLRSHDIVFDTDVVRVNGSGTINLNDERMRLVFKGKPKTFRLIHITAPIVVGGHMGAPKFGIDAKTAIAQGGLAAAFNTVVPFLNFDYARDANCAGLLAEARSQGASTSTRTPAKKTMAAPVTN